MLAPSEPIPRMEMVVMYKGTDSTQLTKQLRSAKNGVFFVDRCYREFQRVVNMSTHFYHFSLQSQFLVS